MSKITDLMAAANILRAADKIPEYQQILNAMQDISELSSKLAEEKDRVRALEAEIAAIKADQLDADKVMRHGDYFMLDGTTLCPGCWVNDKRKGQIVQIDIKGIGRGQQCVRCKQTFAQYMRPGPFDKKD